MTTPKFTGATLVFKIKDGYAVNELTDPWAECSAGKQEGQTLKPARPRRASPGALELVSKAIEGTA